MDTTCSHTARVFGQGVVIFLVIMSLAAGSDGRSITVGDSHGWSAGTNYTQWATKNSPFHINDTLVFKYPLPGNSTIAQSVYMLPNLWSYTTCQFRGAKLLGSAAQGAGEGLKVELNQSRPYYFASAEGNAYDCIAGLTKFIAVPSSTHLY
ncbi:early nodulin-like protein 4 [Lotus japonicus]|uniref:Phytocyanin domain-containing protein n=1 Tax=Lotus japonicus TaxID=34305 RepID=I3SVZ3_LOTJA|nr:early nodulin-like protein 4 [Lotus japonicus]AFK44435.1 unknown [Lotus japonicus]